MPFNQAVFKTQKTQLLENIYKYNTQESGPLVVLASLGRTISHTKALQ